MSFKTGVDHARPASPPYHSYLLVCGDGRHGNIGLACWGTGILVDSERSCVIGHNYHHEQDERGRGNTGCSGLANDEMHFLANAIFSL
jgi:hypothetical protein